MSYTIKLTPLAEAIAKRHRSVDELKGLVHDEIQSMLDGGMESPDQLGFLTVTFGSHFDDDEPKWIVTPQDGDVLLVDSCSYDETEKLTEGPFKGYRVQIPEGDSE